MELETLLKHGWPTAALVVFGLFWWKGVWPFLKLQIESSQEENRKNTHEFLMALARRDEEFAKVVHELANLGKKLDKKTTPIRKRT